MNQLERRAVCNDLRTGTNAWLQRSQNKDTGRAVAAGSCGARKEAATRTR